MKVVERSVRAKCLNLAGGEGVKAKGSTLLYIQWSGDTTRGAYNISLILIR